MIDELDDDGGVKYSRCWEGNSHALILEVGLWQMLAHDDVRQCSDCFTHLKPVGVLHHAQPGHLHVVD